MKHYTFNEQVKMILESVSNINGTEAKEIAGITSCWTFAMIKALIKVLRQIAKGKQI